MSAAAFFVAVASPATAQGVSASVEAATDERRRGISWSEGRGALAVGGRLDLPAGFDIGARATMTRGDPRHGGADAVIDVTGGYGRDIGGGFRVDAFVAGHLFAGAAGRMDYYEGGVGASWSIGPAEVGGDVRYAPPQDAIGGDNLYLSARARVGIPATPYTVMASVGRSSGSADDPVRAARLRPAGSYSDWSLGVEHVTGPLTLGIAYTGTDVVQRAPIASPFAVARHAGDRIAARVSFGF